MIDRIIINNFATIEHIEVDFGSSLNIITGESGAGKSILIEAINIALGGRADISMVRSGCDKAIIQILAHDADGKETIIFRELFASGKSASKLNGQLITLASLREFCSGIVDVHGQYDNQKILNPENHIGMLDDYISDDIKPELEVLSSLYDDYSKAKNKYDELLAEEARNRRQQDYYQFEFDYINNLSLKAGEDDELKESIELMKNSEKIFHAINETYASLNEVEPSVLDSIGRAASAMRDISSFSERITSIAGAIENSYYELEDVSSSLLTLRDKISYSKNELNSAQERLSEIEDAKRKYNSDIEGILAYKDELEEKLGMLLDFDIVKSDYLNSMDEKYALLETQASSVSEMRKNAAKNLESAISIELKDLNFANNEFEVSISRSESINRNGFDNVEFLISTNPGEPLMPLAKIASGGEISRIMLSFKHVTGAGDMVPTMIFDEIDTGISGKAALVVGKKLREISSHHQIICITHLPQIAVYGKHNYQIAKDVSNGRSITSITPLDDEANIKNLAVMISGKDSSDSAIEMAKELASSVDIV